jgi:hypothetical protein
MAEMTRVVPRRSEKIADPVRVECAGCDRVFEVSARLAEKLGRDRCYCEECREKLEAKCDICGLTFRIPLFRLEKCRARRQLLRCHECYCRSAEEEQIEEVIAGERRRREYIPLVRRYSPYVTVWQG